MVQKVAGSIPVSRPTHSVCGYSTVVSIQVFQTWDESSILSTRTKKQPLGVDFLGSDTRLLEEDEIEDSADGSTKDDCQNDGDSEADAVGVIFWSGDDSGFATTWGLGVRLFVSDFGDGLFNFSAVGIFNWSLSLRPEGLGTIWDKTGKWAFLDTDRRKER